MEPESKREAELFKLGVKSGVMMLSELLLASIEVGASLGYGKIIPMDIIEKFINRHFIIDTD